MFITAQASVDVYVLTLVSDYLHTVKNINSDSLFIDKTGKFITTILKYQGCFIVHCAPVREAIHH